MSPCTPACTALYLLYAQLEEEWGLARHAMAVYDRATRAVEPAQQYDMFNIYIKRAAEIYGVTHTRGIYQKAIEVPACGGWEAWRGIPGWWPGGPSELPHITPAFPPAAQVLSDEHAREMCLRFADMECKLGEIDRARAIYSFCSQICDPRVGLGLGEGREGGLGMGGRSRVAHTLTPHSFLPRPPTDDRGLLADVEGLRGAARQRGHHPGDAAHPPQRAGHLQHAGQLHGLADAQGVGQRHGHR